MIEVDVQSAPTDEFLLGVPLDPTVPGIRMNRHHMLYPSTLEIFNRVGVETILMLSWTGMTKVGIHSVFTKQYPYINLPESPEQCKNALLVALGGYVPLQVISRDKYGLFLKETDRPIRKFFAQEGNLGIEPRKRWLVGKYLAESAIHDGLPSISKKTALTLAYTRDLNERFDIVTKIFDEMIDCAFDSQKASFYRAKETGGIYDRRISPITAIKRVIDYEKLPAYLPFMVKKARSIVSVG